MIKPCDANDTANDDEVDVTSIDSNATNHIYRNLTCVARKRTGVVAAGRATLMSGR